MSDAIVNDRRSDVKSEVGELSEVKRKLLGKYLSGALGKSVPERAPIGRRPLRATAPLSSAQQQVWLHEQMAGNTPFFYNETMTIYRHGPLDVNVLERAFLEIIRRHEIWRTTFEIVDGEPVQIVHSAPRQFSFPVIDLRKLPETEREAEARRLATEDSRQPFDLKIGPLLRTILMRMDDERYNLYITVHQIIFDGASAYRVFLRELTILYEAFSNGLSSPLPELTVQYGDFSYWERKALSAEIRSEHLSYWSRQLAGELPLLEWPTDRPRPPIETHRGAIQRFTLQEELISTLRKLSQHEGASLYMVLLAAFVTLLHRYTGQDDIIIGGLSAGRKHTDLEQLLGYFVKPLPLRINLSGNPTFRELLSRVRATVLDALAHEDANLYDVVNKVQPEPDPSRNPFFQIIFSQQPQLPHIPPGWGVATEEISNGGSKLDLIVVLDDRGDSIFGPITYNPDLFDDSTITRMVGHWQTLLARVSTDPETHLADLPILTKAEREQILVEWNDTEVDYPKDVCLHELIENQVQRTPDSIAVTCEQAQLSYRELNLRANQLANYLRKRGVGPDVLVGICMERSVEMVVGLVGVLKAGGAYLPLDPDDPRDRLRVILDDSQVRIVLTQEHLLPRLPSTTAQTICVDRGWNDVSTESTSNPERITTAHNLAYAIYTSGSTGIPKGVLNTHAGIVNRLLWMQEAYHLTSSDRVLQKTTYCFDVSVWEFFWPMITGACLVVARPGGHTDVDYLVDIIQQKSITTTHFVPSMLEIFLEAGRLEGCRSLKRVICSGEALPFELEKRFFARLKAELHNLYGPTEAAVDVTYWQCRPDDRGPVVPIGRPISNVQIYLLDSHLQLVPAGVPGELHIGGVALARGYLNRPQLTSAKFIPDPFSNKPGARLYKTGDLARYRPDGNIEYLGRIDDQVKIRGFRIELGEIESALREHPGVRECCVIVRQDASVGRRLVGYIVPTQESINLEELSDGLKRKLPMYMIPVLVLLDKLPLTSNGKLDRRALPVPGPTEVELEEEFEPPRDAIEQLLAQVWAEVLKVRRIGAYDNFFDLGGHSLSAMQVVTRLHKLAGLRMQPNELAFQTLRQLAASCRERSHIQ